MSAPLVVCVGHAALDHVFEIDAFPVAPTKTPATSYRIVGGGMSANAAVAAARLGARVRFIGAVGDDDAGRSVRQRLQSEGIDVERLHVVAGGSTSVSGVIVDARGERQVFNHRGDALRRGPLPEADAMRGADAVLTDPRWPAGAAVALAWARQHGVHAVLDADVSPREELDALVPLGAWAVFSEPGLAAWSRDETTERALQRATREGAAAAVLTRGERGLTYVRGASAGELPAFRVDALDTTAAGDVFHGALAVFLARGAEAPEAMRSAAAAAAIKCTRRGGIVGAPTSAELEDFLRRHA